MNERPAKHVIVMALRGFLDRGLLEILIHRWTAEQMWELLQTYQSRKNKNTSVDVGNGTQVTS